MSKNILDFLSSYEDELNSQTAFYEKNISRIEGQIKDTKKQITAIKKNIDKEYLTSYVNMRKYPTILFAMSKIMEMHNTEQNQIAMYLINSIE